MQILTYISYILFKENFRCVTINDKQSYLNGMNYSKSICINYSCLLRYETLNDYILLHNKLYTITIILQVNNTEIYNLYIIN